ncbi:hypothetical protein V0288_09285 [Pannus brasiliensis CCIBt3594]|uniref:DeoxyPurine in DNA protein A domain-containing protein n=1 Tax=Pannus brasiliensis CCIBt3594 TaxID=1427578 RepID=A0AAW9QU29_9CHRO
MRFCTKTLPAFFIGCSPSQAGKIISPAYPASGVMISIATLQHRKSDFSVGEWILDSGAFSEIARYGKYRVSVETYFHQVCRWARCGKLLIAVAQDYMCEDFILERTGLSISDHQRLTIERYDSLLSLAPPIPVMPVLQGYRASDYLKHLQDYGDRLSEGMWVGVGSVCRRNGKPDEIADLLRTIKLIRPDLRLHGFGLKRLCLERSEVRGLLHSCDSRAWSYPRMFGQAEKTEIEYAHQYQEGVYNAVTDNVQKRTPLTAGAGNGQGRKPKWNSPTTAIRVPAKFAPKLLEIAREWDTTAVTVDRDG